MVPGECCKAVFLGSFIRWIHESNTIKDTDFSNLYSKNFCFDRFIVETSATSFRRFYLNV